MKPSSSTLSAAIAAAASLAAAASATAVPLLHENFGSATGATPSGWVADNYGTPNAGAIAAKNNDLVAAGNLTVPGLAASSGNHWTLDNSAYQYYRRDFLDTAISAGETLYYSFILQVDDITTLNTSGGAQNLVGLSTNTSTAMGNTVVATLGLRKDADDAAKFNIIVDGDFRGPSNAASIKIDTQFNTGVPILVVASFTRGTTTTNGAASFWINPDSSSFGALSAPTVTATDISGAAAVQSFLVATTSSVAAQPNAWSIDELRVGTTWADVTPTSIPEPATAAVLVGSAALAGVVLRRRRR